MPNASNDGRLSHTIQSPRNSNDFETFRALGAALSQPLSRQFGYINRCATEWRGSPSSLSRISLFLAVRVHGGFVHYYCPSAGNLMGVIK